MIVSLVCFAILAGLAVWQYRRYVTLEAEAAQLRLAASELNRVFTTMRMHGPSRLVWDGEVWQLEGHLNGIAGFAIPVADTPQDAAAKLRERVEAYQRRGGGL